MLATYSLHMLALGACSAVVLLEEDSSMLQSQQVSSHFDSFVLLHGRDYVEGSDEYKRRRSIFASEVERVAELNARPGRLWTAGINHLSDWTPEEFQGLLGWRGHAHHSSMGHASTLLQSATQRSDLESHLWDAGEAADQGACGSCWAVATSKMLEANFRIHTRGKFGNRSFSAQEMLDCTPNPMRCGGSGGCGGSTVELAMAQLSEFGVAKGEDVPYVHRDQQCLNALGKITIWKDDQEANGLTMKKLNTPDHKWTKGHAFQDLRLQSWHRLPLNNGEALHAALLKGTVAVSADASAWSSYRAGVFGFCKQDATINHAIVAVGFGTDHSAGMTNKYWTILNSWGPSWGEGGHIRLLRTDYKYCGTDHQPEQGTACAGGPSQVEVCGMCGLFYDNVFAQFA